MFLQERLQIPGVYIYYGAPYGSQKYCYEMKQEDEF